MIALAAALQDLLATLDRLELPFLIGGSVASGTHGLARQTNHIDIVADLTLDGVVDFCDALSPAFYVDKEAVESAIRQSRAFNVIHFKGAYKFDLSPVGQDAFARSELSRRSYATKTITGLENIEFPVASPEDTILAKVVWFRKGGEVSERQWHDILGVIQVQASRLDRPYLEEWAERLGVSGLLSKALTTPSRTRRGRSGSLLI